MSVVGVWNIHRYLECSSCLISVVLLFRQEWSREDSAPASLHNQPREDMYPYDSSFGSIYQESGNEGGIVSHAIGRVEDFPGMGNIELVGCPPRHWLAASHHTVLTRSIRNFAEDVLLLLSHSGQGMEARALGLRQTIGVTPTVRGG